MEIIRRTCAYATLLTFLASCEPVENPAPLEEVKTTGARVENVIAVDFNQLQEIVLQDAKEIKELLENPEIVKHLVNSALETYRQTQENRDPNAKVKITSMGNRSFVITPIRIKTGEIILKIHFTFDLSQFEEDEQDILQNSLATHREIFLTTYIQTANEIMYGKPLIESPTKADTCY